MSEAGGGPPFVPPQEAAPRASIRGLFSWALFDWANSAFPTIVQTFLFAVYFTTEVAENETLGTAQWGYAIGAAGVALALAGPVLGAIVDQGGRRKPWIAGFSILCIASTALLWFVEPSPSFVWLALVLAALGSIGEEGGFIFYSAMLPTITTPDRIGRWSGWGYALGYAGGLASLLIALFAFVRPGGRWLGLDAESAEHVRATFVLVAAWFLVFALPLFLFTPDAPGTGKPWRRAVRDGLAQLWRTIREARRYRVVVHYLVARMIYTDGLATIFTFAGVYAAGTFGMDEGSILALGIALNVTAGVGAYLFGFVDDRIGSRRTILISLLGLLAPLGVLLLAESTALFWAFGMLLGAFVGPVQAASRSYLARIAPPALMNEMFGLFTLSGKATAFLGPLLVGWVTHWSGSQRAGMSVIAVFLAAGFALVWTLPEAGADDAPAVGGRGAVLS